MENNIYVKTPCGSVKGVVTPYGALYRGIRYATAPRFELPEEVKDFGGEFDATKQGPCSPQMRAYWNEEHRFYYTEFRKGQTFTYSEDCLRLNVFTPRDAQKAPVVIFIHGGSFTGGSINEKHFDGTAYMKRGIVFVTINYRLNVFGFFADGEHSTGNLGLYDQYTAIEWVRHNISAFGGDPDNITLMGQSAGAMSVQTLIASDYLSGKVRRAVMLSGGGVRKLMLPVTKPNTKYWKRVIEASGAKDFEEFKSLPAEQVWTAWKTKNKIGKALSTKPVIDGKLVKDDDYSTNIPIIYGTVKKDLFPPVLKHMEYSFARGQAKKGVPCYIFELNRLLPPDKASFHACDLWYVLGSLRNSDRPFEEKDYVISDEIVDRISEFARTSDPNFHGAEHWAPFGTDGTILDLT